MGGMVLETNMTEILSRIEEQNKLEKQEVRSYLIRILFRVIVSNKTNIKLFNYSLGWSRWCTIQSCICHEKHEYTTTVKRHKTTGSSSSN